jgi:hypothetical protein
VTELRSSGFDPSRHVVGKAGRTSEDAVTRLPEEPFRALVPQAVIAAPLLLPHRQPAVCLGALCAYDGRPVIADGTALATGRIADALTHTVLRTIQADGFPSVFEEADYQAVVHQAAGVISVHCDCGIIDAEALLRAHAFAEDRPVADVAQDVVQGKLRLA